MSLRSIYFIVFILLLLHSLVTSAQEETGELSGVNTTGTPVDGWRCTIEVHVICNPTHQSKSSNSMHSMELPTEDECMEAILKHEYKNKGVFRTNETDKYKTVELADARAVRSAWGAGCVRGTIIAIESGTLFPDQVGDPQIGEDKYLVLWGQDVINTIEFVDAPINTESLSSMDYVAAKVASARDSAINETTHAIHKTVEAATSSFMDGLLPVVKVIVIVFAIIVFSFIAWCIWQVCLCCKSAKKTIGLNAIEVEPSAPQLSLPYYNYAV